MNKRFCYSQKSFVKEGIIFPELELIISTKSSFNPLSTFWLLILRSLCIDCVFSSSCLHFNLTCSIRSLILLGLVSEVETFSVTGKKPFFVFDDSVCFYLNQILSNTRIDFVNNFQLIKYYSEMVLFPNFRSFQDFNFWGKWPSLNVS